ncbi:hypothetical protein DPSP01_003452 [Paraphaeosphaeria sporulosa]|uniref:Uncharacterized protein n=1 Tax=Paraphaeosphaeria sporulosa TaxID=1460663 RepID=A0A177CBN9_9PLEO|nr:uncharacterized protein CC84DRAFT_1177183 [Paraphaeosphaeria sporulosa]OAG05074.1 hypothetical protein CC84DRAFT_1177183 [Paraphaeosphaeria sporulosa]
MNHTVASWDAPVAEPAEFSSTVTPSAATAATPLCCLPWRASVLPACELQHGGSSQCWPAACSRSCSLSTTVTVLGARAWQRRQAAAVQAASQTAATLNTAPRLASPLLPGCVPGAFAAQPGSGGRQQARRERGGSSRHRAAPLHGLLFPVRLAYTGSACPPLRRRTASPARPSQLRGLSPL